MSNLQPISVNPGVTFRRLFAALSAVAALCVAGACGSKPSTPPAAVTPDTWAVVDGRAISREDVEKTFRRTREPSQRLSDEEALAARLTLLDELIVQNILIARAGGLKLQVPDSELDTAYAEAKKNLSDADFQQELTRRNLTAADMREGLRRELLSQKVLEQEIGSKVAVTDQEVANFFAANRAQFNFPEEAYHIAQIVVTPVREAQRANRTGDDAATPQAAAAKLEMLTGRLRAGESFRELAMDYSEDPVTAARGGDLGFVPVSTLKTAPKQLRDAVLGKTPGTLNVVTSGGAHTLVAVVAHERAGQRDLSTPGVRDQILETLRGRKEQLLRAAYLTSMRDDAEIVNHLARRLVESPAKVPSLLPSGPSGG